MWEGGKTYLEDGVVTRNRLERDIRVPKLAGETRRITNVSALSLTRDTVY